MLTDPERLLEPGTRGDPQSPPRWTCKSVRQLARKQLCRQGHAGSHQPIGVARGSWLTRGRVFHSVRKSLYGNAAHELRNRAVGVLRPTAPLASSLVLLERAMRAPSVRAAAPIRKSEFGRRSPGVLSGLAPIGKTPPYRGGHPMRSFAQTQCGNLRGLNRPRSPATGGAGSCPVHSYC